jgi:hypothetical protein
VKNAFEQLFPALWHTISKSVRPCFCIKYDALVLYSSYSDRSPDETENNESFAVYGVADGDLSSCVAFSTWAVCWVHLDERPRIAYKGYMSLERLLCTRLLTEEICSIPFDLDSRWQLDQRFSSS